MEVSAQVEGLDQVLNRLGIARDAVNGELNKALYASAKHVEAEAKKSIAQGKKSGRIYHRRTVTHQASAPGEAPATDTGRLINSINSYLNAAANEALVIAGRGSVIYAAMLEFGTRLIAPRPFMFPALEKSREWISNRIAQGIRAALR